LKKLSAWNNQSKESVPSKKDSIKSSMVGWVDVSEKGEWWWLLLW